MSTDDLKSINKILLLPQSACVIKQLQYAPLSPDTHKRQILAAKILIIVRVYHFIFIITIAYTGNAKLKHNRACFILFNKVIKRCKLVPQELHYHYHQLKPRYRVRETYYWACSDRAPAVLCNATFSTVWVSHLTGYDILYPYISIWVVGKCLMVVQERPSRRDINASLKF